MRGKNDRRDKKMPLELIFISGGVDVSLGVMLVFEFTICRTQTNVPLAPTTVEPWDLDTCAGTSRYNCHAGDRKRYSRIKIAQGSFRCERKQCNVGEILDENGLCTR